MHTLRILRCIPAIIVPVTFSILASAATITATNANNGAVTITVTNTNDSGPGSLRSAITSASSGDTIKFHLTSYPATITLSSTLNIDTSLTISGPGASNLAISGNGAVRVFQVASGMTVTFSGVTIEKGVSSADGPGGGGILSDGTVSLINSTVSANVTLSSGGGIFGSTVSLINSTVTGNNSGSSGGGIYGDTVSLINSTVAGNSSGVGGGIYSDGTVSLINRTVAGNGADMGGGICCGVSAIKGTVPAFTAAASRVQHC